MHLDLIKELKQKIQTKRMKMPWLKLFILNMTQTSSYLSK
jgi:hypothetical protein